VLQHDQPAGAGWLVEDQAQKVRGPAFGLAEAGPEQTGEGDESGPGLAGGTPVGNGPQVEQPQAQTSRCC
jgi:hypothetical protein